MTVAYKGRTYVVTSQKPENEIEEEKDSPMAYFYGAYIEDAEDVGPMIIFGEVDLLWGNAGHAEVELKIGDDVYQAAAKYSDSTPCVTSYLNGKEVNGNKFVIEY